MGKYNWHLVLPMVRNTAVGSLAGYVAGGSVADAKGRHEAAREGALIGAVVGSATGLPFRQLTKMSLNFSKVVAKGLKATPESHIGGALRAADKVGSKAGIVFRRVRGRIIPIRG